MNDDPDEPSPLAVEIVREVAGVTLQRFIRENFGLYHPPGDYRAIRAENLRRTASPSEITRRTAKVP